ncbi:MAG: 50S ribosomal protein L2 [Candidatus Woesearchaeota archaeon]
MGKSLTQQKRGKGSPAYTAPSFKYVADAKLLQKSGYRILDMIICRGHSAPLAEIMYNDNSKGHIIAAEGMKVGNEYIVGADAPIALGNSLPLGNIPEGTLVYNIEACRGDGGKYIRTSGGAGRIVNRTPEGVIVLMPSKKSKTFNPSCYAIIGIVAGGERKEKPFVKAGNKYYKMKARNKYWPIVSGVSRNAVDHPFGGSRTSKKGKPTIAPKNAPPGRKVGKIRPRRTGRKK